MYSFSYPAPGSISGRNLGCRRNCSSSFRGQEQGAGRGGSLEGKEALQRLGQGSDFTLCPQPRPFGTPLSCPALQSARPLNPINGRMGECVNELAGNKVLLLFCHLPTHSNGSLHSPLRRGLTGPCTCSEWTVFYVC